MFGFPQELSEFGLKEYLRLTIIVCAYILVKPLIEKLFAKLGQRARLREKKRHEEKMARQFKEQRVKEKLGIATESLDAPADEGTSTATAQTAAQPRKSIASMMKKKKPDTKQAAVAAIMEDFSSDEDISDLIPPSH